MTLVYYKEINYDRKSLNFMSGEAHRKSQRKAWFVQKAPEERNIKMSKSDIINLVLTKMSTAEFEKIATSMAAAENARQKVLQIYENSGMTKEDLEDILKRL